MSYILDALKRADADRSRGAVPGLHTPPSAYAQPGGAPRRGALPWLLGAGALTLVGGAGWWFGTAGQAQPPMSAGPDRTAAQTQAPPRPPAAAVSTSAVGMSTVSPVPALAAPKPADAAVAPVAPVAPIAPVVPTSVGAAPARAVGPTRPRSEPDRGRDAAPTPSHVPTAAELPPTIRQQLPALTINGSRYSEEPARRLLVLQGQVYREGDRLGPDWTLEKISPGSAVLNFRGHRYQVPL